MADKKGLNRLTVKRKENSKVDKEKEKEKEKVKEKEKEKKEEKTKKPGKPEKPPEKPKTEEEKPTENGERKEEGAEAMEEDGELLEPIELPPFEIIIGERMSPFYYKFQFRNVEYSSGRNKTFLCYLVDIQDNSKSIDGMRGYLEDEHAGFHAEDAFFQKVLPQYDAKKGYVITWYMSSSPCAACAAKIVEVLRARTSLRLTIFCSRIFLWEEPEVQEGLKALAGAGCKLRMMRPLDFNYTWDTFVETEDQTFTPWEDCQENYDYYDEKLSNILQ